MLVKTGKNFETLGDNWLWPFVDKEVRRDGTSPRSKQGCVAGRTWRKLIRKAHWVKRMSESSYSFQLAC